MKAQSPAQAAAMNGTSFTPKVRATLEWNWNRYRYTDVVDNVRKDEDYNENYDIGPIDSIVLGDRPPAGIAKAMVGQCRTTGVYDDMTRKPRFYLAGVNDKYKYWISPYKSSSTMNIIPKQISQPLDISELPVTWKLELDPPPEATTMQAVFKDAKGYVWINQITVGTTGTSAEDLKVIRCKANGDVLDYMTLTAAGHGVSLGVDYVGSTPHVYVVWTDDPNSTNDLVSFPYVAGTTITRTSASVTKVWTGPMGFVGFDIVEDLCVFRYPGAGALAKVELRRFSDVKAGTDTVLKTTNIPSNPPDSGFTFQGVVADNTYIYVLTGIQLPERSYINRYKWTDGSLFDQIDITQYGRFPDGEALSDDNEPEGITIYKANGSTALMFGTSTGGRDYRKLAIYAIEQPPANIGYNIDYCEPRIAYSQDVNVNKIVVGVENSWTHPVDWEIQVGTGVYPHINWKTALKNPRLDSDGRATIYLGDDGRWTQRPIWTNVTTIRGVRVVVNSISKPDSNFSLIEISARNQKLYSDRLIGYNFDYTASEPDLVSPVGIASSNMGSVTFDNTDGHFYGQILQKNVLATVDVLVADREVRIGEMYSTDWDESSGTMVANIVDASRILQERTVPSMSLRDLTPMQIIWAICDAVGFNDVEHYRVLDDTSHKVPFWYTAGGETAWQLIQDIARPHQLVVTFNQHNVMTVRTNKYMYNKDKNVDGTLVGNTNGGVLSNITDFGRARAFQINRADIKWYKPSLPSTPIVVWQPSGDVVLRSSQLVRTMTKGATEFAIPHSDAVVWPYSGRIFVQGEIIEYDAKKYIYYDKSGQRTASWVTSAAQKSKIDGSLTKRGWGWKSKFNGDFRVSKRGYGTTGAISHPVDIDYWQPASGAPGGDMKPNKKWMHHDKQNSLLHIHTPRSWSKDDLYWATRGSVLNGGFRTYGTRLRFNKGNKHGYAGIVFGIYGQKANDCYLVQLKTTKVCTAEKRKYVNEVSVLRKSAAGYRVLAPKSQSTYDNPKTKKVETYKGEYANIAEGVWHNLDITVTGGVIAVYLDGAFQMSVIDPGPNLPNRGRMGVYARGATDVSFDFFYAGNGPQIERPDQSAFIDKINGGFTTIQYQHEFVYRERMTRRYGKWYKQKWGGTFFDEFGPLVHEVREFSFSPSEPIFSGRVYTSNDQVVCTDELFSPFHTSFWLANASRDNAVVNGQDSLTYGTDNEVNQIMVAYGRQLKFDDARSVTRHSVGWENKSGDVPITIDSKWIQTKGQAEDIADWITGNWGVEASEFTVGVWVNPFYEIGDRVHVDYDNHGIRMNQDYFVTGVSYGWDNGMTTSLNLRQVPAD